MLIWYSEHNSCAIGFVCCLASLVRSLPISLPSLWLHGFTALLLGLPAIVIVSNPTMLAAIDAQSELRVCGDRAAPVECRWLLLAQKLSRRWQVVAQPSEHRIRDGGAGGTELLTRSLELAREAGVAAVVPLPMMSCINPAGLSLRLTDSPRDDARSAPVRCRLVNSRPSLLFAASNATRAARRLRRRPLVASSIVAVCRCGLGCSNIATNNPASSTSMRVGNGVWDSGIGTLQHVGSNDAANRTATPKAC